MKTKDVIKSVKAAGIVLSAAFLCLVHDAIADEAPHDADTTTEIQKPRPEDFGGVMSFSVENDIVSGEDNNYTSGVRFAVLSAENNIPDWLEDGANALPFFASEGHKRWHFAFGQSIYTPTDITNPNLIPDDRPYAGWSYGSIGLISDTDRRLDNLMLTVGMVGPASGAEQTQRAVHHVINSPDPKGWEHQLNNEPGVILTYERKWRNLYEFSPSGWGVDFTPSFGGSLGNIHTHLAAGGVVRLGYDLPSDYGPPLIRPNLPGSDFFIPRKDFGWYLFAGLEGRAVARDIFLDGNSFSDSHSVDKYPFVGGIQGGIAFTFSNMRVAYTHVLRTKSFHGQEDADEFGALSVAMRF